MPWNNNNGPGPWGSGNNNQRPGSPWGGNGNNQRPGGPWGGGGRGPSGPGDLDAILQQLRNMLPSGFGGASFALVAVILLGIWGASGFYRVQPDEQGVVLRFGAYTGQTTPPGLNYHLPWPIESVETPQVTRINRVDIGFRSDGARSSASRERDIVEESLMLTGDENIVDISFTVLWRIRDVGEFLFNTRTGERSSDPESMVKAVSESGIREVMGHTNIQPALGEARAQIEQQVQRLAQDVLNSYNAGIEITQVQLQRVDPPAAVIEAFRDVQRANTDRERERNQAEGYRNDLLPRARGEAQQVMQAAQAERDSNIARARGEAQRFTSVLQAYQAAKDITMRRMYLETMEEVFRRNNAVVIDDNLRNVLPFMSLGTGGNPPPVSTRPGRTTP